MHVVAVVSGLGARTALGSLADSGYSPSVKLTTAAPHSQTYEGTLFTACPVLNIVAINTRAASANDSIGQPGDYHIIPVPRIQAFQVTALTAGAESGDASFATAQPAIGPVDTKRLKEREQGRINKLKEDEENRGRGVTKEAQAIFDSFRRMYALTLTLEASPVLQLTLVQKHAHPMAQSRDDRAQRSHNLSAISS